MTLEICGEQRLPSTLAYQSNPDEPWKSRTLFNFQLLSTMGTMGSAKQTGISIAIDVLTFPLPFTSAED